MLNQIQKNLLEKISDLHKIPTGAIALRVNGKSEKISQTADIIISPKTNKKGLDIVIKKGTKNKSLHIPVLIDQSGVQETVYNNFEIQDNCEILIVAGCGMHTDNKKSKHNGIHTFHIGKNCKVKYIEKHLGLGTEQAQKELSPTTKIELGENSVFEMETTQIGGVTKADRKTTAKLKDNAKFLVKEKVLTSKNEIAESAFDISLNGKNSSTEIISRVVAKDKSSQKFVSNILGKNDCFGRVECDGIILNHAKISSTPALEVLNENATLSHEAQIGKIAGDELIKLMTLGLSEKEAEEKIIAGYLK